MSKKRKIIIMLVIALAVATSSGYAYKQYLTKQQEELVLATRTTYWAIKLPTQDLLDQYNDIEKTLFNNLEGVRQEAFDLLDVATLDTLQEKHLSLFEQAQNRLITEYINEQKEIVSNKAVKIEATEEEKKVFIDTKNSLIGNLDLDVANLILLANENNKEVTSEIYSPNTNIYIDDFTKIKEVVTAKINELDVIINTINTVVENRLEQESNNSDGWSGNSGGSTWNGGNANVGGDGTSPSGGGGSNSPHRPTQDYLDTLEYGDCEGLTMGPDGTTCS